MQAIEEARATLVAAHQHALAPRPLRQPHPASATPVSPIRTRSQKQQLPQQPTSPPNGAQQPQRPAPAAVPPADAGPPPAPAVRVLPYPPPNREDAERKSGKQLLKWMRSLAVAPGVSWVHTGLACTMPRVAVAQLDRTHARLVNTMDSSAHVVVLAGALQQAE